MPVIANSRAALYTSQNHNILIFTNMCFYDIPHLILTGNLEIPLNSAELILKNY